MKWQPEEVALLRRLYPDYLTLKEMMPRRSVKVIIEKARHLGLSAGRKAHGPPFTPEEIAAVKGGATSLPGRSKKSFWRLRAQVRPDYEPVRFRWTPELLDRCAADPAFIPKGQSRRLVLEALRRRGIEAVLRDAPDGQAKARPKANRAPIAANVVAAAPHAPGADLLRACYAMWPSGRMDDLAQDIISEMVLGILDGRFSRDDLPAARRGARAIVRQSHPDFGHAPLRMDDPMPGTKGVPISACLAAP